MSRVNNDAVDLEVRVDLNWYILGHQFAESADEDQYNFLTGMYDNMKGWGTPALLMQLQMIADKFDEFNPSSGRGIANILDELSERLKADE